MTAPPMSPVPERLPQPPWFASASKTKIGFFAGLTGAIVFGINLALDFFVSNAAHSPVIGYIISDAVAALVTTFFILWVIKFANERRRAVRHRLYVIAEMNHHIRNALDAIQMSVQLTQDRGAINIIADEARRIEWALREVLGREETADRQP